jgi:hypothetical protein
LTVIQSVSKSPLKCAFAYCPAVEEMSRAFASVMVTQPLLLAYFSDRGERLHAVEPQRLVAGDLELEAAGLLIDRVDDAAVEFKNLLALRGVFFFR